MGPGDTRPRRSVTRAGVACPPKAAIDGNNACNQPRLGAHGPGQVTARRAKGAEMQPRGVKKGTKRARQYEHVKRSERRQGRSEGRAKEIAARTVQKERARSGESRQRSRTSTQDISSGRRGGLRSGRSGPRGRTRDQLYNEAKNLRIEGRSRMTKARLQRAVDAKKH